MGLGSVPAAERMHIAFFGLCNAGKSSLVNAFCSQPVSIVSEKKGTTTDPVVKTMELLPLGPVVIIDTPGIDDRTELGLLRIERAEKMLRRADIAILAKEAGTEMTEEEEKLLTTFREKEIPCIIAYTKSDLLDSVPPTGDGFIYVSAKEGMNINELKEMVGRLVKDKASRPLVEDLVEKGDVVVLVIPIDSSAPKGRLILPQQMMMRSLLDAGAIAVAVQPEELPSVLSFVRPRLVITDSQAFSTVSRMVPEDIPMTSFSILMARYKGELDVQLDGVSALGNLKKGDKVVTIGGIHGTVVMVKDKTVIIKVDDSARIEFNKSAISSVVGKGTEKPQKKDKDGKEAVENKGGEAGSIGVDSTAPAAEEKAEEKNEDKTDK